MLPRIVDDVGLSMLQIGLIWLALTFALIAAAEAAYRLGAAVSIKARDAPGVGMIASATLALLALLTAFTFSVANSRYDLRRELAVAEANAISTAFLRQQGLQSAERDRLIPLMRDYVATRRLVNGDVADDPRIAMAERRTARLQTQIWSVTIQSLQTPEGARISTPLLSATNEMFDLAEARHAALEARIPRREIRVLIMLAVGAAAMVGLVLAQGGSRHLASSSLMFALFALSFSLIHDLDTSSSGGIKTSMTSLDRAANLLASP